jgi:serine/threonine-protein kinase
VSLPLPALDSRVELRELLGEGGMGEVHAAWDRSLQRAVAVKFVRGSDPRDAERLLLEARLQARVESPHVVRVFEVGSLGGRPCILLQLVPGQTLDVVAGSLPLVDRVELVRQAATGIHAAHQQGLVHRDVKPGNVLVETEEDGTRVAYVTDFGLAHAEEGGLTRSGLLPGTLDFMAPEQLAGGGPVDFRSDVYALGATLYAVLAGRPPFRIPSAEPDQSGEGQVRLLRRILDEEPPPLASLAPGLARELAVIAAHAMEKEPAARYPSAQALAEDLARFQRGEPIRARPPTTGERLGTWVRRNRTASRAIAAALAILLAAGALALWQSRRAGLDALEAARLGAVASSLESRLRMEYLAPPHDLRPALAAVKAEVEELRPLARQRRGGPASYALGKGLELTGDLDGARAAYERAWALGFRTPQTAEGLGMVLGRIYQREAKRVAESVAPAEATQRLETLRLELREPTRHYLELGDAAGWRGPWVRAQVALLEGDYAGARARAAEVLAADPGRYEAHTLEGFAWLREATALRLANKNLDARAALEQAIPALEAAVATGRSDPEPHTHLAVIHSQRSALLQRAGQDPSAELDATLQAAAQVSALDPDIPMVLAVRAVALDTRARYLASAGDPARADALMEESNALWRRVVAAQPGDARMLANQAMGLYFEITLHDESLMTPSAAILTEALAASAEAVRLAPKDAFAAHTRGAVLTHRVTAMLRSGEDAGPALDELDRLCEAAVRLDPRYQPLIQEISVRAQELRSRNDWRWGRDPRPASARAIATAEEILRASQAYAAWRGVLAGQLASRAELLIDMGADARAEMVRALALGVDEAEGRKDNPSACFESAQVLAVEARRRVASGEDAAPTISRARRLVAEAAAASQDVGDVPGTLATLSWLEARGLAARRQDPRPALGRAERELEPIRRQPAKMAASWRTLASAALERSRWERRDGSSAPAVAAGLGHVERALELDPRDPQLWVLKSRLQVQAGQTAAAGVSLARALAIQPLVKGSPDAKAAEAELAR